MRSSIPFTLVASAALRAAFAQESSSGAVWATPHESYSSSVGVLGCKIDTNRVAYWPAPVDCNNICVKLTYEDRSVHLLRIDQSEGAYDVSYDAWNYLSTGFGAADKPTSGGPVAMDFETVDAEECSHLIFTDDGKLPLSASNSMNFVASCLGEKGSWVGENHKLYNVLDPICAWGHDEPCDLDWPAANQADCPSGIGTPNVLKNAPVYNIQYGTGKTLLASTGEVTDNAPVYDSLASTVLYSKTGVNIALPAKAKVNGSNSSNSNGGSNSNSTDVTRDSAGPRQVHVPLSLIVSVSVVALLWIG